MDSEFAIRFVELLEGVHPGQRQNAMRLVEELIRDRPDLRNDFNAKKEEFLDVRPSMYWGDLPLRACQRLVSGRLTQIRTLVLSSEDHLLGLLGILLRDVEMIKGHLAARGLRLGMTKQDIADWLAES
ncbi:hypothetical protein HOI18_05515 [Candidatus Uhrbacteria bacterium]|jgi:hypothetical protein|nr:hypothetical protein [Candidatus Uhrbacteria bacterium]